MIFISPESYVSCPADDTISREKDKELTPPEGFRTGELKSVTSGCHPELESPAPRDTKRSDSRKRARHNQ